MQTDYVKYLNKLNTETDFAFKCKFLESHFGLNQIHASFLADMLGVCTNWEHKLQTHIQFLTYFLQSEDQKNIILKCE